MSPFTADTKILHEVFSNNSELWKSLSGPIASIELLDRNSEKGSEALLVQSFVLKIKTYKPETTTVSEIKRFAVSTRWDFMSLEKVTIEEIGES